MVREERPVLTRLTPSTLNGDCYRVLKEAILCLDLAPGAPISESTLAAQLGVSKTPVREALARLASEGFIVSEPGRRSAVAGLSVRTIREMYQVRLMLEPAALRHVAPTLTAEDLDALDQSIHEASQALERERLPDYVAASERFHTYLLECSQNQCLIAIVTRLFDEVRRVRSAIYRAELPLERHTLSRTGIENHRRILTALIAGNVDQAADCMRADIQMFLNLMDTPTTQEALRRLAYKASADAGVQSGASPHG